jgi:hypothetical protein
MAFPRRHLSSVLATAIAAALAAVAVAHAQSGPDAAGAPTPPACTDVEGITTPEGRVVCRTENATLIIAPEDVPVLIAGTQVRVIGTTLDGATVTLRLRVRNETDAEQGLSAGGQELYLNLDGERIDARPIGVVRVPRRTGITASAHFDLLPAQLARLHELGGRIDLGVRPWEELGHRLLAIGVVRLDVLP